MALNADRSELAVLKVQFSSTETKHSTSGYLIDSNCKMVAGSCQEMPQWGVVAIRELDHDRIIEIG